MVSQLDIETLHRYRDNSPPWSEIPDNDRDIFRSVHRELIDAAGVSQRAGLDKSLTSGFHERAGVRGRRPKDLWCALFNEKSESFLNNPQLFAIVSWRGVEIGFGAATHPSAFSNQGLKEKLREIVPVVFSLFPGPDSEIIETLAEQLDRQSGWHFRRKTRLDSNENEFQTLNSLAAFVKSEEGV